LKKRRQNVYFVDPQKAPSFSQMEGLKTIVLTGLHGEKMMMVLNVTMPGHTVPLHSHPQEQVGVVYAGKAILRIGDEERELKKAIFTVFRLMCLTATQPWEMNHLLCWTFFIRCERSLLKNAKGLIGTGRLRFRCLIYERNCWVVVWFRGPFWRFIGSFS